MKEKIILDQWIRKAHFEFFSKFEEPFFGVTVNIDCTIAHKKAKGQQQSFFLYYLYRALKAANTVENFRYRIIDKEVYCFDQIDASPTINRSNGTFGFAYMNYSSEEQNFYKAAKEEIERVQASDDLLPAISGEALIHFSAIPWLNFTSLSHARSFSFPDSSPKISFGKLQVNNEGIMSMPVSIHVHHGLADGYHVSQFVEAFQALMNSTEKA